MSDTPSDNPVEKLTQRLEILSIVIKERQAEIEAFAREADEIKFALQVVKRYGGEVRLPAAPSERAASGEAPTSLAQMIIEIILAFNFMDGATSGDIIRELRGIFGHPADPNTVRPTLWRLVKTGRLIKIGDRYNVAPTNEAADVHPAEDPSTASVSEAPAGGREAGPGGGT
jgi:hypothetical protein